MCLQRSQTLGNVSESLKGWWSPGHGVFPAWPAMSLAPRLICERKFKVVSPGNKQGHQAPVLLT